MKCSEFLVPIKTAICFHCNGIKFIEMVVWQYCTVLLHGANVYSFYCVLFFFVVNFSALCGEWVCRLSQIYNILYAWVEVDCGWLLLVMSCVYSWNLIILFTFRCLLHRKQSHIIWSTLLQKRLSSYIDGILPHYLYLFNLNTVTDSCKSSAVCMNILVMRKYSWK